MACPNGRYFFFGPLGSLWLSALPAAVFDFGLVRLSLRTLDAAVAAFLLVTLLLGIVIQPLS